MNHQKGSFSSLSYLNTNEFPYHVMFLCGPGPSTLQLRLILLPADARIVGPPSMLVFGTEIYLKKVVVFDFPLPITSSRTILLTFGSLLT